MSGIARTFLTLAVLFGLGGAALGLQIVMTGNVTGRPVHIHSIAAGALISTVFALFYHLVPAAAGSRMAKVHLLLHAIAAAGILSGLFLMLGEGGSVGPMAAEASLALYAAMVLVAGIALGTFYRKV